MYNDNFPPMQPLTVAGSAPVPPSRPLTLRLAFIGALVVGLFSAVGAAILIAQAHDLAERTASDILGTDLGGSGLASAAVDEAANTLVFRGVGGLVSALLIVGVALAVRNGALWARILLTVLMVGALCANGVTVADVAPTATQALDIVAIVLSLVVPVLLFLPPTNRYAAARKR